MTIVNARGGHEVYRLVSGSGKLTPGVEDVCGDRDDRFVLKFEPLRSDVTTIDIHEGAGGTGPGTAFGPLSLHRTPQMAGGSP